MASEAKEAMEIYLIRNDRQREFEDGIFDSIEGARVYKEFLEGEYRGIRLSIVHVREVLPSAAPERKEVDNCFIEAARMNIAEAIFRASKISRDKFEWIGTNKIEAIVDRELTELMPSPAREAELEAKVSALEKYKFAIDLQLSDAERELRRLCEAVFDDITTHNRRCNAIARAIAQRRGWGGEQ